MNLSYLIPKLHLCQVVLVLTPRGENAIQQKENITLKLPKSLQTSEVLKNKAKLSAGGTVEYTAQLLAEGHMPEQIARQPGLTVMTIYGHCAKLIEANKLDVNKVIAKDVKEKIEKAIQKVGSIQFLFPIKSLLPDEITYEMIRCVISSHAPVELSEAEENLPSSHIQRIVALGESKSSSAIPELITALKSEDGNARRLAASALGKIGDKKAIQALMDLLATEIKPQVRQYAVKALGSIGDPRAVDLLVIIAEDENEMYYTRDSAKGAVLRCRDKKSFTKESLTPRVLTHDTQHETRSTPHADSIASYLAASHPRPLTGNWHTGFALDFHSSFKGADWNRSGIGDLVYRLKYQSDLSALPALVEHTRELFLAHPEMDQFDIILSVPSSTQREFNPVQEFCKALSSAFNKPMQTSITKTRQTKPQKEMRTLPQKRDNIAGAFAINNDILKDGITGKQILLVDDLFDSGATLEEITGLLLQHKPARVNVLTFTRTIHADS